MTAYGYTASFSTGSHCTQIFIFLSHVNLHKLFNTLRPKSRLFTLRIAALSCMTAVWSDQNIYLSRHEDPWARSYALYVPGSTCTDTLHYPARWLPLDIHVLFFSYAIYPHSQQQSYCPPPPHSQVQYPPATTALFIVLNFRTSPIRPPLVPPTATQSKISIGTYLSYPWTIIPTPTSPSLPSAS